MILPVGCAVGNEPTQAAPGSDPAIIDLAATAASSSHRSLMMYNLYSITSNQAAICALFRVVNRYVGNLATMPGVFPDYKALIVRTGADGRGIAAARLGMPSSVRTRMPQFGRLRLL